MRISKLLFILMLTASLSGCCYHNMKGYEFVKGGTTQYVHPDKRIVTRITIDSTPKQKHIPFLWASFVSTAPYSIYLKSTIGKEPIEQPLLIHSIKLTSDGQIIFKESEPIKLKATLDKHGGFGTDRDGRRRYNYAYIYRHNLGETLPFKRGRKIYLELIWEIPGIVEKQTHSAYYQSSNLWPPPIVHPLFLNSIME